MCRAPKLHFLSLLLSTLCALPETPGPVGSLICKHRKILNTNQSYDRLAAIDPVDPLDPLLKPDPAFPVALTFENPGSLQSCISREDPQLPDDPGSLTLIPIHHILGTGLEFKNTATFILIQTFGLRT